MVRSTPNKAFTSRKHPSPAKIWVRMWGEAAKMEGRFQFGLDWSQFTCFYPKEELSIQFSCCWMGSVTNPDLASKISAIKTCLWCPAQYIKTKSMLLPRWMGEWFGLTSEQLQMSQAWRDLKKANWNIHWSQVSGLNLKEMKISNIFYRVVRHEIASLTVWKTLRI